MRAFIIAATAATTLFSSVACTQEPSQGTASIPDLNSAWVYPFCCGFTRPLSGPGPVVNKFRMRQLSGTDGRPFPPGANVPLVSSVGQFVGDYSNRDPVPMRSRKGYAPLNQREESGSGGRRE